MNQDESLIGFNFWPSFADTMLAFVIIFIMLFILALIGIAEETDEEVPSWIHEAQENVKEEIETNFEGEVAEVCDEKGASYHVIQEGGVERLGIFRSLQLQRITFRGSVLFPVDEYELSDEGRSALRTVGRALKNQIDAIDQIQIEGHTDNVPTATYEEGNLELGARRAISVFRFLQEDEELNIDPTGQLMSVTSYGEYNPVERGRGNECDVEQDRRAVQEQAPTGQVEEGYSIDSLQVHNETEEARAQNRRIELLLLYGQ